MDIHNEDLLMHINIWQDEHEDKNDWLKRINIRGLAEAFQTLIRNAIAFDEERLKFWIENSVRIERPVYVNAIIRAMQEDVRERNSEQIERWTEFCEWVLSRPVPESDDAGPHENSRENPDWMSSRWAVREFVSTCLEKDVNVPIGDRSSPG